MTKGFIRYQIKNGVEYAAINKAKRIGGRKINEVEWLGRVIDKEKGIYQSRERGTFTFSFESGVTEMSLVRNEKLILEFGDSYLLHEILARSGFLSLIREVFEEQADVLLSLVFYKTLLGGANRYAKNWWDGSYGRILFPNARLASQRISEAYKLFGDERLQRRFFRKYLAYISPKSKSKSRNGLLIDSTGLPNDISIPLTAIKNHNGTVSNEAKLILVLERKGGMPIYFRYAAGNIVDVSTLESTIAEVRAYDIEVGHAIIDAGYFSEKNIKAMHGSKISFILRMPANRKLYKDLVGAHKSTLESAEHLVKYGDRFVYIKRVAINLYGHKCYAYVAKDINRSHDETKRYILENYDNKDITPEEMDAAIQSKGLFVLVSSQRVEPRNILPLYYQRTAIEQVFDISKHNADLLPLRVHSEDAFRGHLLLSFITSVAYLIVNKALKGSNVCAQGAWRILRNLRCKVFDDSFIVQEADKQMNDIAKHVKISFPVKQSL